MMTIIGIIVVWIACMIFSAEFVFIFGAVCLGIAVFIGIFAASPWTAIGIVGIGLFFKWMYTDEKKEEVVEPEEDEDIWRGYYDEPMD